MQDKTEALKQQILELFKEGDIATLYSLEAQAHEVFDEETLHGYYANILDLALERLTDILESHTQLDMSNVQDFATLRALYEYGIEHYSAEDTTSAAALFEVLSGISNDTSFSNALSIHQKAAQQGIPLDTFLELYADITKTQESGSFYINHFKQKGKDLL